MSDGEPINARCKECGTELDGTVESVGYRPSHRLVKVEPCPKCKKQSHEDGRSDGYEEGKKDGWEQGYENSFKKAYAKGFESGVETGSDLNE